MNILIIGGTRYFGIPMTNDLIGKGHSISIATRGKTPDLYGDLVSRIIFDRADENSIIKSFSGKYYDVIIDKIAYSSNDVKRLLDHVRCGKYILMSSSAVYNDIHANTSEDNFLAKRYSLKWCERSDYDYSEVKRQAECAVVQHFPEQKYIAVRYPVVIGSTDYTKRIYFYIECIQNGTPMFIDDMDSRISFIHENDAGLFLSHLVDTEISGAINGCSDGNISLREMIRYIEERLNKKAIITPNGTSAPYNGYPEYATLNTSKAKQTGFSFSDIKDRFYETIDHYVQSL